MSGYCDNRFYWIGVLLGYKLIIFKTILLCYRGFTRVLLGFFLGSLKINYNEECNICNMKEQNTLTHILLHCPIHSAARSAFMNNLQSHPTNVSDLLNPITKIEALRLSRFVTSCLTQLMDIPPE